MDNRIFDIGIIGAGPAGMTAAIYAGRAGKTVAIIEKEGCGGNIAKSPRVENIPGFATISGFEFAEKMFDQMLVIQGVEYYMDEILSINKDGYTFILHGQYEDYACKTVIVATGSKPKALNLNTKDIYYCVTCDGPFFKGQDVIVVGSGNTGATYAIELSSYCNKVYLCDITEDMCCEGALKEEVLSAENIAWFPKSTITGLSVDDDGNLSGVVLSGKNIGCKAIFSAIGMIPQTDLLLDKAIINRQGYVEANENCINSLCPGTFVAGDCRTKEVRQVTTAVNDGTVAAINAIKYLKAHERI